MRRPRGVAHATGRYLPQKELAARIRAALPSVLARQPACPGERRRGPRRVRARQVDRRQRRIARSPDATEAFAEDMVMGVPQRVPRWVISRSSWARRCCSCALVALLISR